MSTSTILFIIALVGAIVAYVANVQDSKQKDRIEELGKINKSLSEKIDTLSQINNSIAINNTNLSHDNIALTTKANELISEVEKLTSTSKELISKIDKRTEQQTLENALTGEFDLENASPLKDTEQVFVTFKGMSRIGNTVGFYNAARPGTGTFSMDGVHDLLPLRVINGKLKFSAAIYDLDGDWIATIDNNVWQRNPNNTGRFNYDSKGFEIIDKKGFVALSVNLISRTEIEVQGYLVERRVGGVGIFGEASYTSISLYAPLPDKVRKIEQSRTKQLFRYSGEHWLGKRL